MLRAILIFAVALSAGATAVFADWPSDPTVNVPLCTASGDQYSLRLVSDGAGGAIAAWVDERSGGWEADIYAQRVTADGVVHSAWPTDGLALCTASGDQSEVDQQEIP